MTERTEKLLMGVPSGSQLQFLRSWIRSAWASHIADLRIAHQKDNPLRVTALEDLTELKALAQELTETDLYQQVDGLTRSQLNFLAALNIPRGTTLHRWAARSKKIDPHTL